MRDSVRSALLIGSLVAACVLLAGIASTLALRRGSASLDIHLASLISADYSVDAQHVKLAPLDERIIEEARRDQGRLQTAGGADSSSSGHSGAPTPRGTPTSSPRPTPTPRPSLRSSPTPTTTLRLTPTPTVALPLPTLPIPTPTPTIIPALPLTFYLHNEPSPPIGDTISHPTLRMDALVPVGLVLFNYDTDRDLSPGLVIARGGSGANETDPLKHQVWRTLPQLSAARMQGNVTVEVWSAMKGFTIGRSGSVTVFLRDFDGAVATTIAQNTLIDSTWQDTPLSWSLKTFTLNVGSYTVPAGHRLELKLIAEGSSDNDIWFAYDTISYPSRVKINQ